MKLRFEIVKKFVSVEASHILGSIPKEEMPSSKKLVKQISHSWRQFVFSNHSSQEKEFSQDNF